MRKVVIGMRQGGNSNKKVASPKDTILEEKPKVTNVKREREGRASREHIIKDFKELNSFSDIKKLFKLTLNQKGRQNVQKFVRKIQDALVAFANELEDIGLGSAAKKVRKGFNSSLNELLQDLPSMKSKEFVTRFQVIQKAFESLDPKKPQKQEISYFDKIPEIFDKLKSVKIKLPESTPAAVKPVPVLFFLYKKLSDIAKNILTSKLGAQFAPYTGAMLLDRAAMLVINKEKYANSNMKTVATSIVSALSKDGKTLVPLFEVSKSTGDYYAVMVVRQEYLRTMQEVLESVKNIDIYLE